MHSSVLSIICLALSSPKPTSKSSEDSPVSGYDACDVLPLTLSIIVCTFCYLKTKTSAYSGSTLVLFDTIEWA